MYVPRNGDCVLLSDRIADKRLFKHRAAGEAATILQCTLTSSGERHCLIRFREGRGIYRVCAVDLALLAKRDQS